jgi:hypothetical protein
MKNLIIPPKDLTTSFLSPFCAPLKNKTVIYVVFPNLNYRN